MATTEDFNKIDVRVGKIIDAEDFTEAKKPSYKLKLPEREVNVGEKLY